MLERSDDGFACPRACGYWHPRVIVVEGVPLSQRGTLVPDQLHPRVCPTCQRRMQIRRWARVTIDVCARHGCWVAAEDRDYFLSITESWRT